MSYENHRCDLCGVNCRERMAPIAGNLVVCELCAVVIRRRSQWADGLHADELLPVMKIRWPEPPPAKKRGLIWWRR